MNRITLPCLVCIVLLPIASAAAEGPPVGMPDGGGSYDDLVALFDEFHDWSRADVGYDAAVAAVRQKEIAEFQERLADMAVVEWQRAQQVDWLAVRSRFDEVDFTLRVSRPWFRDPGFYTDRMLQVTFTELPVEGEDEARFVEDLATVVELSERARANLTEVAADYADLAIRNLSNADGVGHGFPYRPVPPRGVIGWYDDLLGRAREQQPELVDAIEEAKRSVVAFHAWLVEQRPSMTAPAGVGKERFDWYLRNVKLMPYDSDQIVTLGLRELDRLWSVQALEQHRNRDLPRIELSSSAQEYEARIAAADEKIREYLVAEDIITIPDYIGELDTNVPWIVRPEGPNFWEQVQFRDPTPDHLHAVIPGHRFDAVVEEHNTHPIRGRITSGGRAEGWATYLEEAMLNAGLLDDQPRVRELIYVFSIFRAARVPADVWLQQNEMTVEEVVDWWMARVPWLDEQVARVDAEIYLRRPPGYGLGYTIGALQMQKLLADRKRQLRDGFDLKTFHDDFMAAGRLPISLIRWEMTGLDDEVRELWSRPPIPQS
ncbi:MAG: DUF885 family protein [Candidatus Sulfomarinibacteraceae bacterium]